MSLPDTEWDRSAAVQAAATGLFSAADALAQACRYWELLAGPGHERGFMGPRELPILWSRHILPCASLAGILRRGASVIDIGSGAGLPGLPVAIARPDLSVTLLEPLLKRSVFLQECVDELGLTNVTVVRGRAEDKQVMKQLRAEGGFHFATSRAVASLAQITRWSLPLLRVGGEMLAMKGASAAEEIARDARDIRTMHGSAPKLVEIPVGGAGGAIAIEEEPVRIVRVVRVS
ncbi:MAG: 16S rRNA (guanine(527)-N(7))-methyltransferase RsmG [Corynebacterium sp.]|nr:16S rRNA (guanine(527)-N(7))-methyltransferase RsmG [Corynebacterium sp.]